MQHAAVVSPRLHVALALGFWAALGAALTLLVFSVCLVAVLLVQPLYLWDGLAGYLAYARANPPLLARLAQLMLLLLGPLLVLLLSSIHELCAVEQRPLTRASLCFGLAFAALTGSHYVVQLTAVPAAVRSGSYAGLEQIVQANPYSAMSAINMLGWTLCLGLATLLAAAAFSGSGAPRVIRVSLLVCGASCLLGGVGYGLEQAALVFVTINLGMGGALTVATLALALHLYRWRRGAQPLTEVAE